MRCDGRGSYLVRAENNLVTARVTERGDVAQYFAAAGGSRSRGEAPCDVVKVFRKVVRETNLVRRAYPPVVDGATKRFLLPPRVMQELVAVPNSEQRLLDPRASPYEHDSRVETVQVVRCDDVRSRVRSREFEASKRRGVGVEPQNLRTVGHTLLESANLHPRARTRGVPTPHDAAHAARVAYALPVARDLVANGKKLVGQDREETRREHCLMT